MTDPSAASVDLPTLGEIEPAAVRCWERITAVLPESDPTNPDDPSVNLDTLMAILYCALTRGVVHRAPRLDNPSETGVLPDSQEGRDEGHEVSSAAPDHVCGPDCQCGCEAGRTIPVRSAATALRSVALLAVLLVALSFAVLLAWFTVEWPQPLPLIPRVIGWVFWPSITVMGGVCLWKAR